ncbi:MAG: SRPBCC family protein [Deltaproteobacteria bacterium]|nr:SRPBCC family protein [Deltaproteobacteria bacterium]
MAQTTQAITIRAPLKRVFGVITDFAHYPEFLPEIRAVKFMGRTAKRPRVQFTAKIVVPLSYTLQFSLLPPNRVTWKLTDSALLRKNEGGWALRPAGNGATEAEYSITLELGPLVPRAVTDLLVGSTLPGTLKRFKERIERG